MLDVTVPTIPSREDLVEDLKTVRRRGIVALRDLDLPALRDAAAALGDVADESEAEAPVVETVLRRGLSVLGVGNLGVAAEIAFGIAETARGDDPAKLRSEAADYLGVSRSRFRNHHEHLIVDQIAQEILRRCHERRLQLSALQMRRGDPVSSRLAVAWMDRFSAYYSMWTAAYATGKSIAAYRSTLLDKDRPWDREPTPEEPDGYTQELQAQGYGSQGLYYLAEYLTELRRFRTLFGGHWILTSKAADTEVADASYLVHYHAPFSARENSFLRRKYSEAGGLMDTFRTFEDTDRRFADLHDLWQRYLATCECTWPIGADTERGYFHTHHTVKTISENCEPHQLIAAANTYCMLIDQEWDLLADWYHIGEPRSTGVDGEVLYTELRRRTQEQGINVWPPWASMASEESAT